MLNNVSEGRERGRQHAGRTRLTAEDRRGQLISIGLSLLRRTPLYSLSLDQVAAEAGISRGLLFHYFPTKTDYFSALVDAAGRRVLRNTEPDQDATPDEQVRQMTRGLVEQIDRRRESYLSFARGAGGADLRVSEVYDAVRDELTERVVGAMRLEQEQREVAHAWWAYVEDFAIEWSADKAVRRTSSIDQVTDHCVAALRALLDLRRS